MLLHFVHSNDVDYSGQYVALSTKTEIVKHWLVVNQRYTAWVLDTLETVTENGVICLPASTLYFYNHFKG